MKIRALMLLGIGLLLGAILFMNNDAAWAQAVENDYFVSPLTVVEVPFHQYVNLADQTTQADEPTPSCFNSGAFGNTVWYAYTPPENRSLALLIDAQSATMVGVYTGNELASLSEVGCYPFDAYGPPPQLVAVQGGNTYRFQFGSIDGDVPEVTELFAFVGPVAVIWYPDYEPVMPNWPVTFHGYGSYDIGEQPIETYTWDFGDGTTVNGPEVSYSFPGEGTYPVKLTVTTTDGRSASTTRDVTVQIVPLSVGISYWPYSPNPDHGVAFEVYVNNNWPYTWIQDALWDFGDGTTGNGSYVWHSYTTVGDYLVKVTATSADGRTGYAEQLIQVRKHDVGITKLSAPQTARAGQTRQVSVEVKNLYNEENVTVYLYANDSMVGWLRQTLPPRTNGKAYTFAFSYTFTQDDARVGKVTFRAEAVLDSQDGFLSDNSAIATPPTKVSADGKLNRTAPAEADMEDAMTTETIIGIVVEPAEKTFLPLINSD